MKYSTVQVLPVLTRSPSRASRLGGEGERERERDRGKGRDGRGDMDNTEVIQILLWYRRGGVYEKRRTWQRRDMICFTICLCIARYCEYPVVRTYR
jgi:hypothetical protein